LLAKPDERAGVAAGVRRARGGGGDHLALLCRWRNMACMLALLAGALLNIVSAV